MAKTKVQKQEIGQRLLSAIQGAKSVVFANFQGLKITESDELRSLCRKEDMTYVASKKTVLKHVLAEAGLDIDTKAFDGGIAVVVGNDETAPSRIVAEFAKTHEAVRIFGGIFEGSFIDSAKVKALSALPTKHQLLGQLVGTLNAPVSGFVNVLSGNLRGLVTVLNAVKESKV